MGEFFKPWRRKIGVVTLVMACVLAAGWMRSLYCIDAVEFYSGWNTATSVVSVDRSICWARYNYNGHPISLPTVESIEIPPSPSTGIYSPARPYWGIKINGFRGPGRNGYRPPVLEVSVDDGGGVNFTRCAIVPYWSIVIPLTVLSACLLLSKPRKTTSRPTHV